MVPSGPRVAEETIQLPVENSQVLGWVKTAREPVFWLSPLNLGCGELASPWAIPGGGNNEIIKIREPKRANDLIQGLAIFYTY